MYTYKQRVAAVKLYIESCLNENVVFKELGYPSPNTLYSWYREYLLSGDLPQKSKSKPHFTEEQIKSAVKYYYEHGRKATDTVRAIGYPNRMTLKNGLMKTQSLLLMIYLKINSLAKK